MPLLPVKITVKVPVVNMQHLAPRYLGLRVVIAKSFARIHWQNLVNFGILPLTFVNPEDYQKINQGDVIVINNVPRTIKQGMRLRLQLKAKIFRFHCVTNYRHAKWKY